MKVRRGIVNYSVVIAGISFALLNAISSVAKSICDDQNIKWKSASNSTNYYLKIDDQDKVSCSMKFFPHVTYTCGDVSLQEFYLRAECGRWGCSPASGPIARLYDKAGEKWYLHTRSGSTVGRIGNDYREYLDLIGSNYPELSPKNQHKHKDFEARKVCNGNTKVSTSAYTYFIDKGKHKLVFIRESTYILDNRSPSL